MRINEIIQTKCLAQFRALNGLWMNDSYKEDLALRR